MSSPNGKFRSLGIDPSPTATAMVILQEHQEGSPLLPGAAPQSFFDVNPRRKVPSVYYHMEIPSKNMTGMARVRHVVNDVMTVIHNTKPDRIVLEGYSLNFKNASSVIPLVELGGALRLMMHLDGLEWFEPRASELKKFVSGKGNSPKDAVMMGVYKRWGYEAATNNLSDAYALAAMGLAQADRLHQVSLDMLKIVKSMKVKVC